MLSFDITPREFWGDEPVVFVGRLISPDGAGVPNWQIHISKGNLIILKPRTDADGYFETVPYNMQQGHRRCYAEPTSPVYDSYDPLTFHALTVYQDIKILSNFIKVRVEYPPPGQGNLAVDTKPIKAEVYVNGESWGTAPQSRNLDPSTYTVSFGEVQGYTKPEPQTATVTEGQTTTITGKYTPIGARRPLLAILAFLSITAILIWKKISMHT